LNLVELQKSIQTYGAGTSPWFRNESFSDKVRIDLPLLPRGVGCGDLSVGIDELKARPNAILNSSQKRENEFQDLEISHQRISSHDQVRPRGANWGAQSSSLQSRR
jgi:hypothetical protein